MSLISTELLSKNELFISECKFLNYDFQGISRSQAGLYFSRNQDSKALNGIQKFCCHRSFLNRDLLYSIQVRLDIYLFIYSALKSIQPLNTPWNIFGKWRGNMPENQSGDCTSCSMMMKTPTFHRLWLAGEIPPGWRSPQPGRPRPGRPSER